MIIGLILFLVFTILTITSLIIFIVKRKKRYLLGFFGFLAGDFLLVACFFILSLLTFARGSFLRYVPGTNKLIVHNYNYKTSDLGNEIYNHFNTVFIEDVYKVEYGFVKETKIQRAMDKEGAIIAREGLPFGFFIRISGLTSGIEYIRFNSAKLIIHDDAYDMFKLNDVHYQGSWHYAGLFKRFKKDRIITAIQFKKQAVKYLIKNHQVNTTSYDEISQFLDTQNWYCTAEFDRISFNVEEAEEITVRADIDLVQSNGEIIRIVLDDMYKREHIETELWWRTPLKELPKEKVYKLRK